MFYTSGDSDPFTKLEREMAVVETSGGRIEGSTGNGLHVFRGIPYASAPVGELRWLPPQPKTPWSGVREAKEFGEISWQPRAAAEGPLAFTPNAKEPELSEDCLSLNIWTPGLDSSRRPVMFWIHGGGFTGGAGSSPIYDGRFLSQRGDVVVVSINYRLGVLGFLNLNEVTKGRIPATGNEGLLDQVLALKWVQDNISSFGGDPNNVTVFGESAGGMSIGGLLGLPAAKGLFHKAIPQSGAASTAYPLDRSVEVADRLLNGLELSPSNDIRKIQTFGAQELTAAGAKTAGDMRGMVFQPCVDGDVLPQLPIDAVRHGSADGVDVLVGATKDEWRLFAAMDPSLRSMEWSQLERRLDRIEGIDGSRTIIEAYRAASESSGDEVPPGDIFCAIESDRAFRLPGIRLAEAIADRGGAAYQYLFTVASPAFGGHLGSCHAIDIGFVFGTHSLTDGTKAFFGSGSDIDQLGDLVQDAWIAFAHSGSPQVEPLDDWKSYSRESRSTAILGLPSTVESAPFDEQRALWDNVPDGSAIGRL